MKGVFHWLSMNLPRSPASDTRSEQDSLENDKRIASTTVDGLMPDIYDQATGKIVPLLKIIKNQSQSTDGLEGFDPYNTGSFEVRRNSSAKKRPLRERPFISD